jgi:hypothetical protein
LRKSRLNSEINCENIWKIRKKSKLKTELIRKFRRKVNGIVNRFGKYGRKLR